MSIDITFTCLVGVPIETNSAYVKESITVDPRCDHVKALKKQPKFCPTCGQQVGKPYTDTTAKARKDLMTKLKAELLDPDDDTEVIDWANIHAKFDFVCRGWAGEEVWCGIIIGGACHDESHDYREYVPKIPPKEQLFKFLDRLGLKYKKSDYGVWSIVEHS